MATTTTNLGLTKPIGTEKALVSVINSNMDIIDNKVGAIPQNESAQSQITALNNHIAEIPSSTTCNSLDDVKTYLTGVMNAMSDNEIRTVHILTGSSFSGGYFKSSLRYSGHVVRFASGQISFDFSTRAGDIINGGLLTSTWTFSSVSNQIGEFICNRIHSGDDLNDCKTSGIYLAYDGTYSNAPVSSSTTTRFGMLVLAPRTNFMIQIVALSTQNGGIWARKLLDTSWTSWTQIVSL